MRKYQLPAIIISLILVTLLMSGCTTSQYGYNNDKASTANVNYHSGTQGIYMKFLPETPPARIFANSQMDIMVEYSNKGAWNINNGKIYLSGFDTQYIRPTNNMISNFAAEGKSVFNPYGTVTQTATFSVPAVTLPSGVDKITQTIKATACYEYQTEASIEVCIDPKTTNTIRERTCTPQTSYSASSQGAPIAVTKVEQETYQSKLQFRIYFNNVGGGTVFKNTAINDCHTSLSRQDANKIDVVSVEYSGRSMNCKPLNPVTIDDKGQGFVFCEAFISPDQKDTFKTVLQIKLRYGYRSSVQTNVDILMEP